MTVAEAKQNLRLAAGEEPLLLKAVRETARRHPKTGLLAGLAFGLVLGACPEVRRLVGSFLSLLPACTARPRPSPLIPPARRKFSSSGKFR